MDIDTSMVDKRRSPDYSQISFYVRKEVAQKFRALVLLNGLTQSEIMEEMILDWINQNGGSDLQIPDRASIATTTQEDKKKDRSDKAPHHLHDRHET